MRTLAFVLSALALSCTGCGGDDDEACDPPSLTGKAFAQDKGTSTVSGEVTLPSSVPDGRAHHEGWYPGTVDAPLTSPGDGTEVAVADGEAVTGIDFGVGPKSP